MTTATFTHTSYMVRRKIFKIFGGAFHIYAANGQLLAYCKMKAFKLKEDIRLYTDETMRSELLVIQARQILDISAAYDVFDPVAGVRVGALRRKGIKSMLLRDEWAILDGSERELGMVQEEGSILPLVRRYVGLTVLFPQKYAVLIGQQPVASFRQNFNPFVFKLNVDLSGDSAGLLDRRLAMGAALLLAAIEGRQRE